jgi:hypothetical protein
VALAAIPQTFQPDVEEEVRVAVAHYFRELGFEANEMSFEDKFTIQLGHTSLDLGVAPKKTKRSQKQRTQVAGRSDLLLARNGRPLAIVETKAPDHILTEQDALQALSYARLLLDMAPYAIVTNGRETRVYDTFAHSLDILNVPTDSLWYQQGQQVLSIDDDLRSEAAQTIIGINADTLRLFCNDQVSIALEDLKGTTQERKPYLPEAYLPRQDVVKQLTAWLGTGQPCFAVIGDSGVGKTTSLCAAAEQLLAEGYFVLFYSAGRLKNNLETAIRNDFVWEFHRERELAHFVKRLDEVAHRHKKKAIIFLDALDRFPGKQEKLKAELLDLVPRFKGRSIRLCLSCKSFDWERFVMDDARNYNKLATAIYPPVQRPQAPDAYAVGMWLHEYTNEELDQIFPLYQTAFSLQGSLQGTTRAACRHPLLLRLLAEVWSNRDEALPQKISQRELFEAYWNVQLGKVQNNRWRAEQWLCEIARISVEAGRREVNITELRQRLSSIDAQEETYQDLVRAGLLSVNNDAYGQLLFSFSLDTLRSYVYTRKVQTWPQDLQQGKSQEVAKFVCHLLDHPIGVEVVEFYLRTVDRGETRLLTDIALHDIYKFAQLMEIVRAKSFVFTAPPGEAQGEAFNDHLTQFIIAYSDFLHTYFPALCDRIEPYTKGEIGLWISGSMPLTMYQFRERTPAYPDPLLVLPQDAAQALMNQQASQAMLNDIRPGGNIRLDLRGLALVEQFPQKLAWERILSHVAHLLVTRCFDETTSPYLLQERIWHLLSQEPSIFVSGVPVTGNYWQVLGFQTIEEIQDTSLIEVITRTEALIEQYKMQAGNSTRQDELKTFSEATLRWYVTQLQKIQRECIILCVHGRNDLSERRVEVEEVERDENDHPTRIDRRTPPGVQ